MKIDKDLFYTVEDYFDIALHKDLDSAKEFRYEYGLRFTETETKKIIRALTIKQTVFMGVSAVLAISAVLFSDYLVDKYSPVKSYSIRKRRNLRRFSSLAIFGVAALINNKLFPRLAVRRLCKMHIKRSGVDTLR